MERNLGRESVVAQPKHFTCGTAAETGRLNREVGGKIRKQGGRRKGGDRVQPQSPELLMER